MPGTIRVLHGSGSAKRDSGQLGLKVDQSVPIPPWANRATVFLNGWKAGYLGGNQKVLLLGTAITKIRTIRDPVTRDTKLAWNAIGLFRDNDGEEGFHWTYNFTVIAWEDSNLSAVVDHGFVDANDSNCSPDGQTLSENYYEVVNTPANGGTDSAISRFFSLSKMTALGPAKQLPWFLAGLVLVGWAATVTFCKSHTIWITVK